MVSRLTIVEVEVGSASIDAKMSGAEAETKGGSFESLAGEGLMSCGAPCTARPAWSPSARRRSISSRPSSSAWQEKRTYRPSPDPAAAPPAYPPSSTSSIGHDLSANPHHDLPRTRLVPARERREGKEAGDPMIAYYDGASRTAWC